MAWTNIPKGGYASDNPNALTVNGKWLQKGGVNHRAMGISLLSLQWADPEDMIEDIASSELTGCNIIRLPITPSIFASFSDKPIEYVRQKLAPMVTLALSKGWDVIIDWHPIADWTPNPSNDAAMTYLWNLLPHMYKNEPRVIFEIFNEPVKPSPNTLANWLAFRAHMQPYVDMVRSHANNLILMGSPEWSSRQEFAYDHPFSGSDIMYVFHVYPILMQGQPGQLANIFANKFNSNLPMFFSELGMSDNPPLVDEVSNISTAPTFPTEMKAVLDANPHWNFTFWSWTNDNVSIAMATSTPQPRSGQSLRDWAAQFI